MNIMETKTSQNKVIPHNSTISSSKTKINSYRNITNNFSNVITKGIKFLRNSQYLNGEFPTFVSNNEKMRNARYIKSIAMTIAVPYSLKLTDSKFAQSIIKKAIKFVLKEKENEMIWRFFGKNTSVHPDLDDTSYALAFLMENGIKMDYQKFAKKLLAFRNKDGLFYTWFPNKGGRNVIDFVVNTNILYFFALLGWRVKEVEKWIEEIIKKQGFKEGSYYYHMPCSFIYFFSRLNTTKVALPKTIMEMLVNFLIDKKDQFILDENYLNSALMAVSLLNMGYNGPVLKNALRVIVKNQNQDGGWPIASIFRHRTVNLYYGSRALSTAFAMEALIKYQKINGNNCNVATRNA